MAFKMKGSPAKRGAIMGTAGHSSAIKAAGQVNPPKAEYAPTVEGEEQMLEDAGATQHERMQPSGAVRLSGIAKGDQKALEARASEVADLLKKELAKGEGNYDTHAVSGYRTELAEIGKVWKGGSGDDSSGDSAVPLGRKAITKKIADILKKFRGPRL